MTDATRHVVEALAKDMWRAVYTDKARLSLPDEEWERMWHEIGLTRDTWNVAARASLAFARARVPEARLDPPRKDYPTQDDVDDAVYTNGWNACRAALLARLGGEEG